MITCSEKDTQAPPGWASPRPRPLRHGFRHQSFLPIHSHTRSFTAPRVRAMVFSWLRSLDRSLDPFPEASSEDTLHCSFSISEIRAQIRDRKSRVIHLSIPHMC